ncbi:MAG: hypothetical protein ACOX2O_01445 [Bdellovibrionota bacterium]|jgi:hypothetical protein
MQQNNELKDVRIKAGNPDNEIEIRNIIKLFTAEYGQSFPEQGVYDMQFWSRRISTRFSSILALMNNKIIAHLAIQPDRKLSNSVQVTFPAVDPQHLYLIDQLAEVAWQMVKKQAERHRWSSVYALLMSKERRYQQVASDTFGLLETAIFPHYFRAAPQSKDITKRRNAIFAQKILSPQSQIPSETETLYVPQKHLEACKYLYNGSGLKRSFQSVAGEYFAVPTDIRACEARRYYGQGFSHVYITPSLLTNFNVISDYLSPSVPNLFFVSMKDPSCPDFCQYLEDHGLSFCGVLPLLRNRECIVYTQITDWDLESADCFSERSKYLVQYISETLPTDSISDEDFMPAAAFQG